MSHSEYEWELPDNLYDAGFPIREEIRRIIREKISDLEDLFPFKSAFSTKSYKGKDWFIIELEDLPSSTIPIVGTLEETKILKIQKIIDGLTGVSPNILYERLGGEYFGFSKFTYIGRHENSFANWPRVVEYIFDWLNNFVIPEVIKKNETRVQRAIPTPPQFDIGRILKSIWILECEKLCIQGTAFMIDDGSLVTCNHVIGSKTQAFQPTDTIQKYSVEIAKSNKDIDLAILNIDKQSGQSLEIGSADSLKNGDHLGISGFPNYRGGDTGVFIPGLVVGFRQHHRIRRILTNAAIVSGNSGGPVVDKNNKVVGVAVTGAEQMEAANQTENHGIIPIDALHFL